MIDRPPPPTSTPCPAPRDIRLYSTGGFDEQRASQLEQHLLGCPHCETLLETLDDPSDVIIQALASLPTSPHDETDYQQLREAALAMPVKFADPAEATNLLLRANRLADPALGPLPCRLGNYELSLCIGRGASGAVYRARHLKLDQLVAVKVLDATRAYATDQFAQEMKTIGSLAHPHIVRATDAGEANGMHYLVMEYVDGIDAARLLYRNGPLRVADACEIARQAALGLRFVHEQSLVHRDIKPSNLLVTVEGQVKLLDLGIATRYEEQPTKAKPRGTYDYMPPELWTDSSTVDARTDLYSLGCTLFKLLTGSTPPKPSDAASELQTNIPRAVERLLQRLLAPDPNDRPSAVSEVIETLRPHVRGADLRSLVSTVYPNGTSTKPASCVQPPRRINRRQAALATLATAGAAAMLFRRLQLSVTPRLQRTAWRELAPVAPKLLLSLGKPEQTTLHLKENAGISVSSEALALVHLGRPVSGLFKLEVALLQQNWQGGGVFFQWQLDSSVQAPLFRFQSVELKPRFDSVEPTAQRLLLWSQWTVQRSEQNINTHQTPLAEIEVDMSANPQGQRLQIICGRQGMPEIAWNGIKLHESMWHLSLEARNLQQLSAGQLPTAFLGRLGLLNTQGNTTFHQPRLAYL